MGKRNNIFAAAFDELRRNHGIKTQKELARRMGVSEDTISRILKNRTEVTEDIITKLQTASGCIFNLQWLRGEDVNMLASDEQKEPPVARFASQPTIDQSSMVNALIAANDAAMTAKNDLIAALRESLEDKDELIESLHEQVTELQRQLAQARRNTSMTDYTYPVGVADKSKTPRKKL